MPGPLRSTPSSAIAFEEQYPRTPSGAIVGRGAFGIVFGVASPENSDRRYVAKDIDLSAMSLQKQRSTLVEIKLLRSLSHPNIVGFIDAALVETSLRIVMEYANGGDLGQKIRAQRDAEKRFAERTVMMVFVQIAAALKFVHENKILHRDIKPANIFVFGLGPLETGVVKLGDFGLGKVFDGTTFEANSVVGSPSYFSPEVCKGKPYGRKSDVWSLGVVLHELASLSVPFLAKSIVAAIVMICKTEAPVLPEEYTADLHNLVGRLMQKDPKARPAIAAVIEEPFVQKFAVRLGLKGFEEMGGGLCDEQGPTFNRQRSVEEPEAELPQMPSRCAGAVEVVQQALRQIYPNGIGVVPREAMLELLPLVLPEMSRAAAHQVLMAAGCNGAAVDFAAFLEWLSVDA